MRATPTNANTQDTRPTGHFLSPERRLDAIADVLVRGLARALLGQDSAGASGEPSNIQASVNTSETALINGPGDALMVRHGEDASAAKGGRNR